MCGENRAYAILSYVHASYEIVMVWFYEKSDCRLARASGIEGGDERAPAVFRDI